MFLRLTQRHIVFAALGILFICLFALTSVRSRSTGRSLSQRDPNIVLITVDALRTDHLSGYGYFRKTSPVIDDLAGKGVFFTQGISQSSHAPASLGVIATSTYPPVNGLRAWGDTLHPDVQTLAEILKARGYRTFFVGGNGNIPTGLHGFPRGFDVFYDDGVMAPALTQKALSLIEKKDPAPFFLWIHYMDVHNYVPSPQFESLFINDMFYSRQVRFPIVKDGPGFYGKDGIPESRAQKNEGNDNPDYYIALYDGAIRTVDQEIGRLLKTVKRADPKRGLLSVLSSPNGELFGEHGYYFHHGFFLYDPLIKVPLIFHGDEVIPAKRVDRQVSAGLDIFPTLLGLLKIKGPGTVQGEDLTPLFSGDNAERSPAVISDEGYSQISVRTDGWKLIRSAEKPDAPGAYELFDLKKDPEETIDVAASEKQVVTTLGKILEGYRHKFWDAEPDPLPSSGESPGKEPPSPSDLHSVL